MLKVTNICFFADLPLTGSDSGILKAPEVPKNDFAKSAVESMLTGYTMFSFCVVLLAS